MRINIVVPPFDPRRFSGGIWCILQHAQQLGSRGHEVRVVPMLPSSQPLWFPKPWHFELVTESSPAVLRQGLSSLKGAVVAKLRRTLAAQRAGSVPAESLIRPAAGLLGLWLAGHGTHGLRQGGAIDHLRRLLPAADLTLATDCETAWPVALVGTGRLAYFAQHYEPFFWKERFGGEASRREAEASYRLGLHQLVNSPWLQDRLQALQPQTVVLVVPNAIDHQVFQGQPIGRAPGEPLRIISYGGRNAEWKGFREMCEGLRLLRQRAPDLPFEWRVYGDALLPPDNDICPYIPLGFLQPAALAEAYRASHVLLGASWYESFPLFPLEAMACGLATVTTQEGAEMFSRHGQTALVIPPRDPVALAAAVQQLGEDESLRRRLAEQGQVHSRGFTWLHAGDAMVAALDEVLARPVSG